MAYRNQQPAHTLDTLELRLSSGGAIVTAGTDGYLPFDNSVTSLSFTTSKNGQAIIVLLSVKRLNDNAGGSGRYECWIDGEASDPLTAIMITNDQEEVILEAHQRLVVPTAGAHTLQIRVFAAVGSEFIGPPTKMLILGAG